LNPRVREIQLKPLQLFLPALVAASTLAHWVAARRVPGLWIMPDEAIYAERALQFWRDGSLPIFRGQGVGYGVLYPMLAGLPLAVGDLTQGYAWLKLFQALVMSLAAVPVFFYGRRLMSPSYALVAAALTLASPLLLYSGFVMTEVLFYPLAALTLLASARAVETASVKHQVVALALVARSGGDPGPGRCLRRGARRGCPARLGAGTRRLAAAVVLAHLGDALRREPSRPLLPRGCSAPTP